MTPPDLIVDALARLRSRSCIIAKLSPAMKTALRRLISSVTTAPTAFDLIERNGDDDLRRDPPRFTARSS
jgi:hypothetical protein